MNKNIILSSGAILVKGGDGGNGKVSFRRERFIPRGGPDGGNGGNGGSVILRCNKNVEYLDIFKERRHFYGENGENGRGKMQYGANGKDLYIDLPVGTEVYDEDENLIVDLIKDKMEYKIANSGKGGIGNMHLATSTERAPKHTIPATLGESKYIFCKLKIIADIGLIGMPNAGKSSLINFLTNCKSQVADYAFTTTYAHIGVLKNNQDNITLVDIPGLIEDCSSGKGMGIEFLQNVARAKILVYVLNGIEDPLKQFNVLQQEISNYEEDILSKKKIILINKYDLLIPEDIELIKEQFENIDKIIFISTITGYNMENVKKEFINIYHNLNQE